MSLEPMSLPVQDQFGPGMLGGARVLIVEDNVMIASDLDLMVEDAGGRTAALVGSVEQTLGFLRQEAVDAAILEIRLRDGDADAVVAALTRRGIPVVIYTGMPVTAGFQMRFSGVAVVAKPAPAQSLLDALQLALQESCRLAA